MSFFNSGANTIAKPAQSGELFSNNQPQQPNTFFNSNNNQQQTTTTASSNFFSSNQQSGSSGWFGGQNTTAQPTTSGGLFGSLGTQPANTLTNQNQTSGGLFGNTTSNNTTQPKQPQGTGNWFGQPLQQQQQQQQQQPQSSGGLFGNIQQPNSWFGNTNNQVKPSLGSGWFQPTSQSNNTNPPVNSSFPAASNHSTKYDIDSYELQILLQNIRNSYEPSSPSNLFKAFIYNPLPPQINNTNYNINQFQIYSPYIQTEDGVNNFIDYNLWIEATKANPKPFAYYPIQISSTKQFLTRWKLREVNLLKSLEDTIKSQKEVERIKWQNTKEISDNLNSAKSKWYNINSLFSKVSGKMTWLATRIGKAQNNPLIEKQIKDSLVSLNEIKNQSKSLNEMNSEILDNSNVFHELLEESRRKREMDYNSSTYRNMNEQKLVENILRMKQLNKTMIGDFTALSMKSKVIKGIKNDLFHLSRFGKLQ